MTTNDRTTHARVQHMEQLGLHAVTQRVLAVMFADRTNWKRFMSGSSAEFVTRRARKKIRTKLGPTPLAAAFS